MTSTSTSALLTLASASPRRRQLLGLLGLPVRVAPADVDERVRAGEAPAEYVLRLARAKAEAVAAEEGLVLAADTTVVIDGQVVGKPGDAAEAERMLWSLRGREHQVLTGLVLLDPARGRRHEEVVESLVPMRAYSRAEVSAYVASGRPLDKAGAYGIQDPDFMPVDMDRLRGCATNVMGLPLCRVVRTLRAWGLRPPQDPTEACLVGPPDRCALDPRRLEGGA